jgi:enoyl-[acyl-carrier protein] reductase III
MGELAGRTVLVTGGGRGIGRAVSTRLAAVGATVIVNYLQNEEAAQATCEAIRAGGGSAESMAADVGDPNAVRTMFDEIRARHRRLDALVHSAALGRFQPLLEVRPAEWNIALRTNAHALLLLTREALGLLPEPGGRIVALSSLGSQRYVPFYGAIGASKAALESLVRSLAVELAPRGIRVNAVSAGLVDTETLHRFPQSETLRQAVVQRTPANRLGTADEVAEVVAFLVSDHSSWVYGQTLVADGGLSLL